MLRSAVLPFALFLGLTAALAAEDLPYTCRAEIANLNANLDETLERLEGAWKSEDDAEKCAAIRHHIEVMRGAAEVFGRCTTGHARGENVGQALGTVADFEDIAAELGCP